MMSDACKMFDLFFVFYSVWDRVIGGSSMVLVYVAVTILLSLRKKILGLNNTEQMEHLLNTVN